MRTLLGVGLVLAVACGVTVAQDKKDEKIDAKKLVGKWEVVPDKDAKDKTPPKVTVEYAADGKMMAMLGDFKVEGTYTVEGNKIVQKIKVKDAEQTRTVTVTKLTDEVLEGESDKGVKSTLKRLKDEKKKD